MKEEEPSAYRIIRTSFLIQVSDIIGTYGERQCLTHCKKKGLYDDIARNGVKVPIKVIWDRSQGKWAIKDGRHRYLCAKELGIKSIPAKHYGHR